jgi:peptidoglycan/xylan/chitin deacetylase (PgdA/CDA1 family)
VPGAQVLVRMHRRFASVQREVWLTIDDGPDPEDPPRILELLESHDARATFFVIGQNADRRPELVRAIATAGHEIAHHTQTHPEWTFWCASPARVGRQLDEGFRSLPADAARPSRFRPPVGIKNPSLARALRVRDLTGIGWSGRGLELWHKEPGAVVDWVLRDLAPGAILLMHEGPRVPGPVRVVAIRRMLEQLSKQGYRCVIPEPFVGREGHPFRRRERRQLLALARIADRLGVILD